MSIIKDKISNSDKTIEDMAKLIDVNVRTLNNWFRYKHVDFIFKYIKLIKILELDIDDIIKEYEEYKKKEV